MPYFFIFFIIIFFAVLLKTEVEHGTMSTLLLGFVFDNGAFGLAAVLMLFSFLDFA